MGRHKKNREEVVQVIERAPEEIKPVAVKKTEEQIITDKIILDSNDSEKIKKDVMLMKNVELENHLKYLKDRILEADNEYSARRKLVDGINASISGAQAELHNLRSAFNKQNESKVQELNKRLAEVEATDATLRKLVKDNSELLEANKRKEDKLNEDILINNQKVHEMQKVVNENKSLMDKMLKDISKREEELKIKMAEFETERNSIIPEMDRISAIKNENIILLQEIEKERNINRNMRISLEGERQALEENRVYEASKNKTQNQALANEEARLRKWEQDLKDFDLEVRAKAKLADNAIKKAQLEKIVNSK